MHEWIVFEKNEHRFEGGKDGSGVLRSAAISGARKLVDGIAIAFELSGRFSIHRLILVDDGGFAE